MTRVEWSGFRNNLMEVLLLEDLPGIGKKNDLLIVGDGYAMNNLLPLRKALVATPTVRRRYAEQIRRRAEEKVAEMSAQQAGASELKGKTIKFSRKATKTGKLYAAIAEKVIADEIKAQLKLDVKDDAIKVSEPIKALGNHEIIVNLVGTDIPLQVEVLQEK